MAKFGINVCLKPCATHEVSAALTAAMAPFDINLSDEDFNPHGEWDWWRIDAGDGGRFAVKPEHAGDPRLIHGDGDREPLRCDGGPRGLLDFAATRQQAVDRVSAGHRAEQRDVAIGEAVIWAVAEYALLTLEGQWISPRSLGPFTGPRPGEDPSAAYARQSDAYLDGLGADRIIVKLLCHC